MAKIILASNKQLEQIFGVPVIDDVVDIDDTKIYGYAACNHVDPFFTCLCGSFAYIVGFHEGCKITHRCYADRDELFKDPLIQNYNSVLFEVREDKNGDIQPVGIIKTCKISSKIKESICANGSIVNALTHVVPGTYGFEWEV